jgi:hypothetical protein
MSYSNIFRARMNAKGANQYERNLMHASRDFQRWFDNALGREIVDIDGIEQYAIMQDQNQNNNKDLSDDKYMVVENSSNVKVGSYVKWRGHTWLVFTDENKTIPTHKQVKIKETNHSIKWMIGDKISGNGIGYPAFIQNQTLYTLGVSSSGNHSWIVNAKMMMYLPYNEETVNMKIGQRIVIGGAVYQIMFKDYVSRAGLINYLLEQDMVNETRDNLELGIADYYYIDSSNEIATDEPVGVSKEVVINGVERTRIGSTVTFEAQVFQDGTLTSDEIAEWTIADTEAVATLVEQTTKSVKIYIENNFKKVGSVITIIGKTADGVIGSKTVNILSPY